MAVSKVDVPRCLFFETLVAPKVALVEGSSAVGRAAGRRETASSVPLASKGFRGMVRVAISIHPRLLPTLLAQENEQQRRFEVSRIAYSIRQPFSICQLIEEVVFRTLRGALGLGIVHRSHTRIRKAFAIASCTVTCCVPFAHMKHTQSFAERRQELAKRYRASGAGACGSKKKG